VKIRFLGATGEVTGSCYLVHDTNIEFLIDCGLFQGHSEHKNDAPFPFNPSKIPFLILTHAHLDHSGRLPLLVKRGFKGKILTSPASAELLKVMLLDAAHVQEEETDRINRKRARQGLPPIKPLYTKEDVERVFPLIEPLPYDTRYNLNEHVEIRFRDAGHILGASIVEIWDHMDNEKIVFSGDLGQIPSEVLRDPTMIEEADYVVMETTYGGRLHKSLEETRKEFREAITSGIERGGNILIPSFAVERTQRILYELKLLYLAGDLPKDTPVYLDSPLAEKATEIYDRHHSYYKPHIQKFYLEGDSPFSLPNLRIVKTSQESKKLNDVSGAIIIAGSGMCTGGRILHHLKHHIWKPQTTIVFVGYQAQGTLGRLIVDGAKTVKIFGEPVRVKAKVYTIGGFSAHADQADLLQWITFFKTKPYVILTHGEDDQRLTFANILKKRKFRVYLPEYNEVITLQPDMPERVAMLKGTDVSGQVLKLIADMFGTLHQLEELIARRGATPEILGMLKSAQTIIEEAAKHLPE